MNVNVFAKQQWENYGAPNSYTSDDGGRLQVQFFYPLYSFNNGASLNYFTFTNYDFGSKLGDKDPNRTNEALVSTHVFSYNMKHLRLFTAARYFHNGGQFKDGAVANWGNGDFVQNSTGGVTTSLRVISSKSFTSRLISLKPARRLELF